eukprot:TRINITY_DN20294_c0_g1_i2.p1 TRINITY_DN20294_c0_g1~~TRINITY_DN20294_c0_g1_i2.p1  ORF type:complete len:838 (-),score=163.57 TRINITY_DN20294_c0_g1_i2:114-2342(-)
MGMGMGMGMGMSMGNFDFFAHMAAAARMQAAMFRAMQDDDDDDDEEEAPAKKAKVEDEGAFDKDALHRLAQAADSKGEPLMPARQPPLPPPPLQVDQARPATPVAAPSSIDAPSLATSSSPSSRKSASMKESSKRGAEEEKRLAKPTQAPKKEAAKEKRDKKEKKEKKKKAKSSSSSSDEETMSDDGAPSSEEASVPLKSKKRARAQDASPDVQRESKEARESAADPPEKKKDASSVASLLQQVQSNVARGRAAGAQKEPRDLRHAFGIGAGASATGNSVGKGGLLNTLLRRLEEGDSSTETRSTVQQEVLETLTTVEPLRANDLLVRVHAVEVLRTDKFLDDVMRVLKPSLSKFNSPQLTRLLAILAVWAVAAHGGDEDEKAPKLPERCQDFFSAAAAELSVKLMDIIPRDLSQIGSALASVGHFDARFFGSLARAAVARSDRFTPQEIIVLSHAFDKAGYVNTALCEALAKTLRTSLKDVSEGELVRGMTVLARAGVRDEELGKAVGAAVLKPEAHALSAEELCALAWTFCTLGMYHDAMFRTVFRTMKETAAMSNETLCQLYEVHAALRLFRPDLYKRYELKGETVQSLRDHYKKCRGGPARNPRLQRDTERVHKDVVATLERVMAGVAHLQHQLPTGFAVDVAVGGSKKDIDSPMLVVEIDGSQTLLQTLDTQAPPHVSQEFRARGDILLKRRILQQIGLRLVVLNEELWRSLEDSREKREFLRDILKNALVDASSML